MFLKKTELSPKLLGIFKFIKFKYLKDTYRFLFKVVNFDTKFAICLEDHKLEDRWEMYLCNK